MWTFKKKSEPINGGPEGLQKKFVVTENLPWKGIMFMVTNVEKEKIELTPVGLTWQMNKKIQETRGA